MTTLLNVNAHTAWTPIVVRTDGFAPMNGSPWLCPLVDDESYAHVFTRS